MASERFLPQEVIRRKRDGESLTDDEIRDLVTAITEEVATEGQVAAFTMAVLLRGRCCLRDPGPFPTLQQMLHFRFSHP